MFARKKKTPPDEIIERYEWRPVLAYPSPATLVSVPTATFGQSYFAHDFPMRTPKIFNGSAPFYGGTRIAYPARKGRQGNLGGKSGTAPTEGIYTGLSKSGTMQAALHSHAGRNPF